MRHDFDSIPSNLFQYNPLTKTFFAEASDLNGYDILQRAAYNPTNRGFAMKSTKTGKVVPFYFTAKLRELEEYDGELSGWQFSCGHDDNPNGEHYLCLIVNIGNLGYRN
jgi:hypothetical protein